MLPNKEDLAKFKKLNITDILALSLIVPKEYENTFLSPFVKINQQNTIKAEVLKIDFSPKQMRVKLFCSNFNQYIDAVFFFVKAYHKKMFEIGKEYYLIGKIQKFNNFLQIIQPKIISQINTIRPIYKTSLQNKTTTSLMQKYLTKENCKIYH